MSTVAIGQIVAIRLASQIIQFPLGMDFLWKYSFPEYGIWPYNDFKDGRTGIWDHNGLDQFGRAARDLRTSLKSILRDVIFFSVYNGEIIRQKLDH